MLTADSDNRPFYRYGDHIELIRFKEYYGMPRGTWAGSDILAHYLRALFGPLFLCVFLEKDCKREKKKDRCAVFGCNNHRLSPEKCTLKFPFARKARVNTERGLPGHPIILLKSNNFNMTDVSVKRSISVRRLTWSFLWRFFLTTLNFLIPEINSVLSIKKKKRKKEKLKRYWFEV